MRGNIHGAGRGGRSSLSSVDFYRRVPKDLTEATTLGAFMSLAAMAIMTLLFFAETIAFARTSITTEIALDENSESQIQLNFNVSLFALHCDFVSVDVWDVLGTNRQNVTKNIEKWQLDEDGHRRSFSGRNRETRQLINEEHEESLFELHQDGIHAVDLTPRNYDDFLEHNPLVFIDFYASWCIWCQRLHPTWEKLAEEVERTGMPVAIAKVDCVQEPALCRKAKIMAFPTIRWFEGGKAMMPDYKMDRTVAAIKGFVQRKLDMNAKFRDWENKGEDTTRHRKMASMPENPGCQVSGTLMVNRVPGNFHIEAKSKSHNLNAAMTNLTHRVNHLSFGPMGHNPSKGLKRVLKQVPEELQQFQPLDNGMYTTNAFHQAFHHYIKVVSTHIKLGASDVPVVYQFLAQSQVVYYDDVNVPEARFSYDLSPMSVLVEKVGRKWYDYLTSLCAIIGGTFTTLGLIDATLYKVFKPKQL